MNEHLLFAINTTGTYPAWTTPDKAIPVMSCSFAGARALDRHEDTGSTIRSRRYKSQNAMNVKGSIAMKGYPVYLIPWLFRSFLTSAAQVAAGTGWDNDLLPNDANDVQLPWFSFQKRYTASVAENIRGAVVQKVALSCKGGEQLMASMDFIAADIGRAGQTWSDGTACPAVVTPVPYPATMPVPLRFHEGSIIVGGTPSLATNKMSVAGGTTVATIETFNLEMALNVEGRFAVRDGAPTIAYTRHGERLITFTGDIDWATYGTTYYDAMLAATETCLRLEFSSDSEFDTGQNYELFITLPRMVYPEDGGTFPQLDGTLMPKKQSLKLISMEHTTLTSDIGVSIQTSDDLVP